MPPFSLEKCLKISESQYDGAINADNFWRFRRFIYFPLMFA